LVLGVCLEETLAGEHARRDARAKANAKAKANFKAAKALQRRSAKAHAAAARAAAAGGAGAAFGVGDEGVAGASGAGGGDAAEEDEGDEAEAFELPSDAALDPSAWTSEALQRTIVGRVGFGKFSRTLAQLVAAEHPAAAKGSGGGASLVVAEADGDPWALGGAGFAAFAQVRLSPRPSPPLYTHSLPYSGGGGYPMSHQELFL
jgi:hypothetical protein